MRASLLWLSGLTLIALAGCSSPPSVSYGTLSGRVLDKVTERPVSGVQVDTIPPLAQATTNAEGAFRLGGAIETSGIYRLRFSKEGYEAQTVDQVNVPSANNTLADVALAPKAAGALLDSMTVSLGDVASATVMRIGNAGGRFAPMSWKLTSSADWLEVSPAQGVVVDDPALVTLSANRAVLGDRFGNYTTPVELTWNGGSATIMVTLTNQPPAPVLSFPTPTVDFGANDTGRTLRMENTGGQTLHWELAELPPFISPAARSGVLRPGDFTLLELVLSRRTSTAGHHSEQLVFTGTPGSVMATAAVAFDVSPAASMEVAPSSLDFGSDLSDLQVILQNTGRVPFNYTVVWPEPGGQGTVGDCTDGPVVYTDSKQGTVGPSDGALLSVHVDRSSMKPGSYVLPLHFKATASGQTIPDLIQNVAFVVPEKPMFNVVLPSSLTFPATLGNGAIQGGLGPPRWGACDIQTNVRETWTARSMAPWLTVSPTSGFLAPTEGTGGRLDPTSIPSADLEVDIDWDLIPRDEGDYTGLIEFRAGGVVKQVPIIARMPPPYIEPLPGSEKVFSPALNFLDKNAMTATYDPFRDRLIVYGRSDSSSQHKPTTLEWDATHGWTIVTAVNGAAGPYSSGTAVGNGAMVFDRARGLAVYIEQVDLGGGSELRTWEYDPALSAAGRWKMIATTHNPGPRKNVTLTYDERRNRVLLYGGSSFTSTSDTFDDLWTYDGADWTQLNAAVRSVTQAVQTGIAYDFRSDSYAILASTYPVTGFCAYFVNPESYAVTMGPCAGNIPTGVFMARSSNMFQLIYNPMQALLELTNGYKTTSNPDYSVPEDERVDQILASGGLNGDGAMLSVTKDRWGWGPVASAYDPNHDQVLWPIVCSNPLNCKPFDRNQPDQDMWIVHRPYTRKEVVPAQIQAPASVNVATEATGTLTVTNGAGLGIFRVKVADAWLAVSPRAGQLLPNGTLDLTLTPNRTGLSAGPHSTTVTLVSNAGRTLAVPVQVSVP